MTEAMKATEQAVRDRNYTSTEDSSENDVKHVSAIVENEDSITLTIERLAEIVEQEELSEPPIDDDEKRYIEIPTELKAESEEEGTFEGYGSVFNNIDLGNDIIKPGAFTKSIKSRGLRGVKLLYQHKTDMPIGIFEEIEEDGRGLRVKGKLALKTQAGREAYELLKMGALDGLSIGFRVNPDQVSYDKRTRRRNIKEVDLMEISLVTFPMNPKATVSQVKGEAITIREWENGMRDAFSLSRSEAKVAAKAVNLAFVSQREVETPNDAIVDAIKNLTNELTSYRRAL